METPIWGGHSHGLRSSWNPVKCSNFSSISKLLFKWNMIDEFYQKMKKLSSILHLQSLQWPSHDRFFFSKLLFMRISRKADVTLCNECTFVRGSWKRRRRYGEINAKCQRWPTSASSRTSNGFVTGNLCGRYAIAQPIQARESHLYTRHTVLYRLFIDHKISKSFEVTYCGGDSSVTIVSIYNDFTIAIFFSFRFCSTVMIRRAVRWFPRLIKRFWGKHLRFQRKEYWIKFVWDKGKVWTECYIKDAKIVGEKHDTFIRKWKSV